MKLSLPNKQLSVVQREPVTHCLRMLSSTMVHGNHLKMHGSDKRIQLLVCRNHM